MRRVTYVMGGWLALASTACYQYVPTTIETVPEGGRVRALLTSEAQQRLQERHQLDPERFEGTLLTRNGELLSFFVPTGSERTAFGTQQRLYQQVEVRRGDIVRADLRRLDGFRTASLVAVVAAAAALVITESIFGGDPGQPPPPDGGPPESLRGWLILLPSLRW